jgi:hypothetical protein
MPAWIVHAEGAAHGQLQLTEDTHKFESKYMERLLGGTPAEIPDVYRERSPVHHADRIRTPLLVRAFRLSPVPSLTAPPGPRRSCRARRTASSRLRSRS